MEVIQQTYLVEPHPLNSLRHMLSRVQLHHYTAAVATSTTL